jgi:hypothetical protein
MDKRGDWDAWDWRALVDEAESVGLYCHVVMSIPSAVVPKVSFLSKDGIHRWEGSALQAWEVLSRFKNGDGFP